MITTRKDFEKHLYYQFVTKGVYKFYLKFSVTEIKQLKWP